jgi:hypothetical protein
MVLQKMLNQLIISLGLSGLCFNTIEASRKNKR